MKQALITGITGQDGAHLTKFLLGMGYEVHGLIRRSSNFNTQRIDEFYNHPHLNLHYGDMLDLSSLINIYRIARFDEIYNLAAQSHVACSFEQPTFTGDVTYLGFQRLMEAIDNHWCGEHVKIYQAGSSEMFGNAPAPQSERTRFHARSPYAAAKIAAHHLAVHYREMGYLVYNGILFNHESPLRGETFVTRKITRAATRIKMGLQDQLVLGNLDARRDWGYAGDYVEAMWLMLQQDKPSDFVIGTGKTHSVEEFCIEAFSYLDLDWEKYVITSPRYERPTEVHHLQANPKRAKKILGWEPKVRFQELVRMMVDHDLKLAKIEKGIQ